MKQANIVNHRETATMCNVTVENGITYNLPVGQRRTIGNGIHNDIVVGDADIPAWALLLQNSGTNITVNLIIGEANMDGQTLSRECFFSLISSARIVTGETNFELSIPENKPDTVALPFSTKHKESPIVKDARMTGHSNADKKAGSGLSPRKILFGVSVICVAIATLSAIYVVTGSLIIVNADSQPGIEKFLAKLSEPQYDSLNYKLADDSKTYIVTGTIENREQRTELLDSARTTGTPVQLEVQLNSELIETIQDIFRVNGVPARAQVNDTGKIEVVTRTANLEKLDSISALVRTDLPRASTMEVINTIPNSVVKESVAEMTDPNKRITLISAGANAYIMTEDNSRYFVGAMLPSGHKVEEIRNEEVIVSKNGKRQSLKY